MWGNVTGWVWLLLSLTIIGVLALAVLSIPAPPSAAPTPARCTDRPAPQTARISGTEPGGEEHCTSARSNDATGDIEGTWADGTAGSFSGTGSGSVTTPEPRREARHE